MFWHHDGQMHWGWFAFGMAWMLLFWGAVIWAIVWGIRSLSTQPGQPEGISALETVRKRHAQGEITKEQFEDIKRTLDD